MTSFEFGGSQHRTVADLHRSIACAWLFSDRAPDLDDVEEVLGDWDREASAVETQWDLAGTVDGYDRDELKSATKAIRDQLLAEAA